MPDGRALEITFPLKGVQATVARQQQPEHTCGIRSARRRGAGWGPAPAGGQPGPIAAIARHY
jgi:hypothetical protein